MNGRTLITGSLVGAALLAGALFFLDGDDDGTDPRLPAVAVGETPAPDGPGPLDEPRADDVPSDAADTADAAPAEEGDGGRDSEPATDAGSGVESPSVGSGTPAGREGPAAGQEVDDAASSPSAPSQEPETAEVLRATARAYEGLHAFRAGFEQVLENTLLGRTTRSRGTLFQRQPDRFLMRFSEPEGDLIVSDGEYFWMWFPSVDDGQVIRTPRGSQGLDLRAQFIGDPVRRFEATSHEAEPVGGRPAHVMTLVPRQPAGYTRLKVWIDADDHLVRRFELTEENGNIRRFVLSDLVANPSLPDDLFDFTPPPGAQVVTR